MSDVLTQVLADLAAEGDQLDQLVAPLQAEQWRQPTPAAGWDIASQIAHLAWTDEVSIWAATDKTRWDAAVLEAIADPDGYVDQKAFETAQLDPAELLEKWRTGRARLQTVLADYPAGEKLPWFGPPMSPTSMATARLMETWAHSLDVAEALKAVPEPTDRIRHVAHLGVRTRDFAFLQNGLEAPAEEFYVCLRAPSGAVWTWGDATAEQQVTGDAYDFCLLVTQRRHRDDLDLEATGAQAAQWLQVAQAFAGPPGPGRTPAGTDHHSGRSQENSSQEIRNQARGSQGGAQ